MSVLLPASVSWNTLTSVCPDHRSTGAYREHAPLLLETVTCIMLQSGFFMHALTLVVVLISAGVISCCTSRWVSGWGSPHSSNAAACMQRDHPSCHTDPQSLNEPAAVSSRRQNCKLAGPCSASLLLDSPQPQSVALTRELHGPSSWCCMLHETKVPGLDSHLPEAPSQLPSFTLSGILPATQEGLQNVSP